MDDIAFLEGGSSNERMRLWVEQRGKVIGSIEWDETTKLWYPVGRDDDRPSPEVGYPTDETATRVLIASHVDGLPPEEIPGF